MYYRIISIKPTSLCVQTLLSLTDEKLRMLCYKRRHTRQDRIKNECIRKKVGVASIVGIMVEFHLRCFGQVLKSPTEAPLIRVHKWIVIQSLNTERVQEKLQVKQIRSQRSIIGLQDSHQNNMASFDPSGDSTQQEKTWLLVEVHNYISNRTN